MKKVIIFIFLLVIAAAVWSKTIDRIVAKVGREIIMQSELEKRYEQLQAMKIIDAGTSIDEVLEDMIESKLIILEARRKGKEPEKAQMKQLAEQQIEELKKQFENELEFRQQLLAETGMTPTELKDYYVLMLTEQRLREEIINDEIKSRLHVTEAELEEYYEENLEEIPFRPAAEKLGMIMKNIKPSKETKDRILKEMLEIRDALNKGADFAELAGMESDCPSKKQGGDLGFFETGMMVKPFEEAAFKLAAGEISEIVETDFGYHLIMMEEKKDEQVRVRHILKIIEPSEQDLEDLNEQMNEVRMQLVNGGDFGKLAAVYSEEDSSAANGGIIGEFPVGEYPDLFKTYFMELDYGEYSEVISEGGSLYIFGKLEYIPERAYTFGELNDYLNDKVLYQKQIELFDQWINDLRKESYIEIYL